MDIILTEFAKRRHFGNPSFEGTKIGWDPDGFIAHLKQCSILQIDPGYAPFCKHAYVPNFVGTFSPVAEITDGNRHLLRSGYVARRESELPVLTRWFEGVQGTSAKYLDLILYSKTQLQFEGESCNADWGIVAILAVDEICEQPMLPVTMMRNALGITEGGSGVSLDREAYLKSVAYWETHALIKS